LGGNDDDIGRDIAVDRTGKAYIVGETASGDFPVLNGYSIRLSGDDDAFVTKLDPAEAGDASLLYSSFLGGDSDDVGRGIAIDQRGNIYITGETESSDFPIQDPIDNSFDGEMESFIAMLNPFLSGLESLVYSTFLGGDREDLGVGIALDNESNVYVTGETRSEDFPIVNGFQTSYEGGRDAFIAKLSSTVAGIPSYGGSAAGPDVEVVIDATQIPAFNLLLSQNAIDEMGSIFISVQLPGVEEWEDFVWFRPEDEKTPPYTVLVKDGEGFLPNAEEMFYYQGLLSRHALDLGFEVGAEGLQGWKIVFRTMYLEESASFTEENLKVIQTVTVTII
jgi:hypothetical protein